MSYEFGDVVLVPFPFTHQAASKKRPAVIVSSSAYNRARSDVVVMAITSQLRPTGSFGDVRIDRWQQAGLIKPSVVKPVLATLEQRLIVRRLGTFLGEDQADLKKTVADILCLQA